MKKPTQPAPRRPTPENLAFGRRVREMRDRLEISQYDLAKELDITPGAVGQWELGLAGASSRVLGQLADVLGVSTDWLIRGKTLQGEGLQATPGPETEVLKTMKTLSKDEKEMVAGMVSGLSGNLGKPKRH
jgi:transcriptional regulator with XRE-family HTH domain